MPRKHLAIEEILSFLTDGPERIAAATAGLTCEQLRATPGDGGWSANDVLGHLRSCGDVWGDCIAKMLAADTPTLRAINPRTWIGRTDYLEQDFGPSFEAFAAQRRELVQVLRALPPGDWSRRAMVTGAGNVLERSVLFYADWLARHERTHLEQIGRIAGEVRRAATRSTAPAPARRSLPA